MTPTHGQICQSGTVAPVQPLTQQPPVIARARLAQNLHLSWSPTNDRRKVMGSGSCGNVIAALASFFIPGLGQLLQGRWLLAGLMFVLTALLWLILLGWIIHLWSIIDAAVYARPERWRRYDYRRGY
jgi:TM2 domain-containing membrane protein YozV